jgi:hypothetical protein
MAQKSSMKNILKRSSGPIIAIVILTLTLNIAIDNPFAHSLFRSALNEKLSEYTNLNLDFEALSLSMIPLGVDMYGVKIQSVSSEQNFTLAKSSHLLARVSLWSLAMGTPRLSLIESTDLEVVWPPPWDLPKFLKDTKGKKPETSSDSIKWPPDFEFPVQSIVVKNARIFLESSTKTQIPEAADTFYAVLSGFDLDIDIKHWNSIEVESHIQNLDLAHNSAYLLESTRLDFAGTLNNNIFLAERVALKGERIDLLGSVKCTLDTESSGKIENTLKSISIFADLKSKFDFSVLGSILDIPETRGPVDSSLKITAILPFSDQKSADFKIDGSAKFKDGYLSGFKLFDSSADFSISKNDLSLKNVNLLIDGLSYGIYSGIIKFNDTVDYEFQGSPQGLHLIDLLSSLKVNFDDFDFALYANDFSLKGQGNPFNMTVLATAELSEMRVPVVESLSNVFPTPPTCRSDLKIVIDENKLNLALPRSICFQPPPGYAPSTTGSGQPTAPKEAIFTSQLQIAGNIRFDETGMDLLVEGLDVDTGIAQYFAKIPLSGSVKSTTRIYGPYTNILIDNKVKASDLIVSDIFLGELTGTATVDKALVKWKNVVLSFPSTGFLKSPFGSFSGESMNIIGNINAKNIPNTSIKKLMSSLIPDQALAFNVVDFQADLNGPIMQPGNILGKVSGEFEDVTLGDEKILDNVTVAVLSTKKGWASQIFEVQKDNIAVDIKFTHQRTPPRHGKGIIRSKSEIWDKIGLSSNDSAVASVELHRAKPVTTKKSQAASSTENHLQSLPYAGAALKSIELSGLIEAKANFNGTLEKIQGTLTGKIERLSVLGSPLAPIRFQGFLNSSLLDLTFDHSGNSLKGRLSIDILGSGVPYEWYLSLNHFDLRSLGTKLFFDDPRNYAYATADWKMKGLFKDWWSSSGEINLSRLLLKYVKDRQLNSNSISVELNNPVKIAISKSGWNFDETLPFRLGNDLIDLSVLTTKNLPPDSLGIHVRATIGAGIAKLFSEQIESTSGKIAADISISGPVTNPIITAHLQDLERKPGDQAWEPLSIGVADIRPAFQNIDMSIDFKDNIAEIKALSAEKGSGKVSARGVIDLAQISETGTNLMIYLEDTAVTYPVPMIKSFDSVLAGQISITGKTPPYKIGGDVTIVKARSTRPFDIRTEIINALKKKSLSGDLKNEDPMATFALNIKADRSIVIKNRNIDVLLSADLRIGGSDVQPQVSGQTDIEQGKFVYKQDFVINRGLVTFDDPVRLDPSLDIVAISDVPPYKIFINISGKASDPIVGLSVEPPTREDGTPITSVDTLILLSRGSLPSGKNLTESGGGTVTTEAVNILAGQIEQPLEKLFDLSGQTFIKQFYVDSYASEKDGAPVLRVNMPINLGKNLDVVVRGDRDAAGVSLEYPLHESISVSGKSTRQLNTEEETSTYDTDTGVDLKFRFAFP